MLNKKMAFSSSARPERPTGTVLGLALLLAALAILLGSCSHDPEVVKRKYLESGNRYFDKGQYRSAAIQYQNAVRVDSRFEEAHARLAQAYLRLGMWSGAYQELTRAVAENPDDLATQVALGNLLLAAKEFHRAQEVAQTVLGKDPNNVAGRILLANSYAALDNVEGSLEEMQSAIQLEPGQPKAYLNLAYLQVNAKEMAQAEESFKKAVELDPKSVSAALALGNFYMQQKRWTDAGQQIQRAIDLEPKNSLPRQAMARLDLAEGQEPQAEQVLKDARKANPNDPSCYRLLGDFYFAIGDLNRALAEYAEISKEHPKDVFSEQNYIQLLILHRDFDAAAQLNDKLLKSNSKDVRALIARGEILSGQKKVEEAISALEQAAKDEPDNPEAHYFLGAAFSQKGDSARAYAEWQTAVKLRPTLVQAQRALVALGIEQQDWELVVHSADGIIAAAPYSPEGFVDRATARIAKSDAVDAESDLQRAAQLAPDSSLPYARLAALRVLQKRYADAEKLYERALDRDPNYVEALNGVVQLDVNSKQLPKALARALAQAAKEPQNSGYQVTLAKLYAELTQWDKAEASAQKAVELDGSDLDAIEILGQVQQLRGENDQAAATYQQAIQTMPNRGMGYTLLAQLDESRGDWQAAQALYQKALQVQPDFPAAANNLAYLMLEHGLNTDVALSLAQTARRGLPNLAQAVDTLGWAYYKKGAYDSAVTQLEEAVKRDPQDANFHYHLGITYAKLGDNSKARAELQRALQMNPAIAQSTDIRQILAQVAHNN
jgi:tetratricopeptide (TPR) repeat protein